MLQMQKYDHACRKQNTRWSVCKLTFPNELVQLTLEGERYPNALEQNCPLL